MGRRRERGDGMVAGVEERFEEGKCLCGGGGTGGSVLRDGLIDLLSESSAGKDNRGRCKGGMARSETNDRQAGK